jgi:oxalate decarboxylase/phosphoglucose isomerase-like protein (cupin superfamily)
MPGGVRTEIHLGGADTAGAFCLLADEPPVGWALPAHLHRDHAETIHVVAGEFEVDVDGATSQLAPGQTVHVPRRMVHASRNVGSGPGRRVLVFSPGGMERFFLEAGAQAPESEIERRELVAAAARHGWEFV